MIVSAGLCLNPLFYTYVPDMLDFIQLNAIKISIAEIVRFPHVPAFI